MPNIHFFLSKSGAQPNPPFARLRESFRYKQLRLHFPKAPPQRLREMAHDYVLLRHRYVKHGLLASALLITPVTKQLLREKFPRLNQVKLPKRLSSVVSTVGIGLFFYTYFKARLGMRRDLKQYKHQYQDVFQTRFQRLKKRLGLL